MTTVELIHGDALEFLASLPPDSVDLVFGSPQYSGKGDRYGDPGIPNRQGREWATWMADIVVTALRACPGLVAFVVDAGVTDHRWDVAVARLIVELDNRNVHQARAGIYRRNGTPGNRHDLRNDYEMIVRAKRPGPFPYIDLYACAHAPVYGPGGAFSNRNSRGQRAKRKPYKPPPKANPGNNFVETYTADEVLAYLASVGDSERYPNGGGHLGSQLSHKSAAPFSEKLADFYIRTFSRPGSTVVDPFVGSGTMAAAAQKAGRNFIGCDIDADMIEITRQRCGVSLAELLGRMKEG